jgi:REP element-mobilizing transposase RayT
VTAISPRWRLVTIVSATATRSATQLHQLAIAFPRERTHGGNRPGAGRPRKIGKREPAHTKRPKHHKHNPVHVVLRTCTDIPRLRTSYRVVHVSVQHNHIHLLVEASGTAALSAGMQQLAAAIARGINRALHRRGHVFAFRFHATEIDNPRQARNTLAYVLNNWRRHREDERGPQQRAALLDPYSSAIALDGWRGYGRFTAPRDYGPLPVAPPRTWLLAVGWRAHGDLDPRATPGPLARGYGRSTRYPSARPSSTATARPARSGSSTPSRTHRPTFAATNTSGAHGWKRLRGSSGRSLQTAK